MTLKVTYDYKERDYAKNLDAKAIRKELKFVIRKEGEYVQKKYKKLQNQFKNKKNKVTIRRRLGVGTSPDGKTGTIYSTVGLDIQYCVLVFLEDGTDYRYRNVSFDWKSRSKPGSLTFGQGKGRATNFGYNPGITARNFRDVIIEEEFPIFVSFANEYFHNMFKRANWV